MCFEGNHTVVAAMAALLVLLIGLVFPVVGFVGAWRIHRRQHTGLISQQAGEQLGEPYLEKLWWFGPWQMVFVRPRA